MPSRLSPCPSCTRHVKVGAASCPFCGGAVPTHVPARVYARSTKPLTRAAILFAGAAAVTACGDVASSAPPIPVSEGDAAPLADATPNHSIVDSSTPPHHDADTGGFPILYGPASIPDAMVGGFDAAYGVFVHPDAGEGFDGGPVAAYGGFVDPDAGVTSEDAGQGMAAYGVFAQPDSGS